MTEQDPISSPVIHPVEDPICPLCLEHNPIGEEICRRCRTPLVQITGPTFEIDDQIYLKPIALIGTWLMTGPIAAISIGFLIWGVIMVCSQPIRPLGPVDIFGVLVFLGHFGSLAFLSCGSLFRSTRVFIRHRTRSPRGFQPIMPDQSSDNSASPSS